MAFHGLISPWGVDTELEWPALPRVECRRQRHVKEGCAGRVEGGKSGQSTVGQSVKSVDTAPLLLAPVKKYRESD